MADTVDVKGMAVAIGMPIFGGLPSGAAISLFKTVQRCTQLGVRLDYITLATSYVHISRDWVVDEFLKGSCQKLFFIDQDMTWEPDYFLRLLALSTKRDVVGSTYPAKVEGPTTFYVEWLPEAKSEEFGLIKVKGMPLGFTVIDRSVLERLAAKAPRIRHPVTGGSRAGIFRVDTINGDDRGEDIAFFADVAELGVDVWMDPGIALGHIGQHEWRGRILDALQATEPANRSAA